MERWRLLDTGRMTAAENMALDEVLLGVRGGGKEWGKDRGRGDGNHGGRGEGVGKDRVGGRDRGIEGISMGGRDRNGEGVGTGQRDRNGGKIGTGGRDRNGEGEDTIRFLMMAHPAVLIGFNQAVEQEVRIPYCREHGIHINRRITGGGAIFFDRSQLGWEVICRRSFMDLNIADARFFRRVSAPVITALRELGVDARYRPLNDIEVNGRKISGTGGTEDGDAFLFQGTLLVDFDVETMLRALRIPVEKLRDKELASVRDRVTWLGRELGRAPGTEELKRILARAFEQEFDIRLEPGGLTPREADLLHRRLGHFRSDDWIGKVRLPAREQGTVSALHKAPGGLIRVSMMVNQRSGRIRSVLVTGDFFAYPPRAIPDLEAMLRDVPATEGAVERILTRFFSMEDISLPGVSGSDMLAAFRKALDRLAIARHGIPLPLTNGIFTVCGSFDDILEASPSRLLLPYCARSTECGYRYEPDCPLCGGCSMESATALGKQYGLSSLTILSFEHLMQTLRSMERDGVTAFVGCCCEGFYAKHEEDFREVGLPGILIDIDDTTCYDLGKEHEAYAGRFESRTTIKCDLLEMVLRALERRRTARGNDDDP